MKTCKCSKKIRNEYNQCYDCSTKSENKSDTESLSEKYVKEVIPKTVRNCLFINYFGNSRIGTCMCCQREPLTINNFNCGHIEAEKYGGTLKLDNLLPICTSCNLSMGTTNLNDFIKKYNLHYGLNNSLNTKI